ncbi:MAG: hypothetical protein ACRD04_06425 [Terriglobales bacterium]
MPVPRHCSCRRLLPKPEALHLLRNLLIIVVALVIELVLVRGVGGSAPHLTCSSARSSWSGSPAFSSRTCRWRSLTRISNLKIGPNGANPPKPSAACCAVRPCNAADFEQACQQLGLPLFVFPPRSQPRPPPLGANR